MKTILRMLLGFAGFVALWSAPVFAQGTINITAKVPFEFNVGKTRMPPAAYKIQARPGSPALTIQTEDGKAAATVLTTGDSRLSGPNESELRFRVYAGKRYFAAVWSANMQSGREIAKSPAERETERAGIPMQVAVLRLVSH